MILAVVFFVFLLSILILTEFIKKDALLKYIGITCAVLLLYMALYGVLHNGDWDAHKLIFLGEMEYPNAYFFSFVSSIFNALGYGFVSVYRFHIILIACGLILFVTKFQRSYIFPCIFIYLVFQIVPLSNQIRYYVAFFLFLNAIANLIVLRKIPSFYIYSILAISSHLGILLMYPFLYFYYNIKKYERTILLAGVGLAGVFLLLWAVGSSLPFGFRRFEYYLSSDSFSSIKGGVFNVFIWCLWICYVWSIDQKIHRAHINTKEDSKYNVLYKLSFYSVIFVPTGLFIQILAHRYIIASLIIGLCFCFYSLQYERDRWQRLRRVSLIALLFLVTFLYQYILPYSILTLKDTISENVATRLLKSNENLQFIFK